MIFLLINSRMSSDENELSQILSNGQQSSKRKLGDNGGPSSKVSKDFIRPEDLLQVDMDGGDPDYYGDFNDDPLEGADPEVTLEEGEGEVALGAGYDSGGGEEENEWKHPSNKKVNVGELEAYLNITIPPTGVTGNCPVDGCGKWFQHLRTHIVSMHAPKEACKHCGVEIIPR